MDHSGLIIVLCVAVVLVICGTAVVRQPQLLSNYHVFTEEEKSFSAFRAYLKSVRNATIGIAVLLVGGELLAGWLDSRLCSFLSFVGIFLLLFYLFYMQGRVSPRMKRKSRIYGGFLLVVFLGVVALPLFRGTTVCYEQDTLCISGLYGEEIPRSEIRQVSLERTLPEITWRSNGFAAGSVKKGHFRTADGRNVKLFLESDKAPFLHIRTTDGKDIYLNSSDGEEMRTLYRKIIR